MPWVLERGHAVYNRGLYIPFKNQQPVFLLSPGRHRTTNYGTLSGCAARAAHHKLGSTGITKSQSAQSSPSQDRSIPGVKHGSTGKLHEQVTQTALSPTTFAAVPLPQFTSMATGGILYGELMKEKKGGAWVADESLQCAGAN